MKAFRLVIIIVFFSISATLTAQNPIHYDLPDQAFHDALELYFKRQYGAARKQFEEFIRASPHDAQAAEAEYYRALTALKLFHLDGEPKVRRFAEERSFHGRSNRALFEKGNFFFHEKDWVRAIESYEDTQADRLKEEEQQLLAFRLAYAHFARRNFDEALEMFNRIKRGKHTYAAPASYYAGFIHYQKNEYDLALLDLERISQNETYSAIVPYMIANIYYRQEDYDRLIAYYEGIKDRQEIRNQEEVELLVGESYFRKGEYKRANTYFSRYLENEGKLAGDPIRFRMGFSYYADGNFEQAVELFLPIATKSDSLAQFAAYYLGAGYVKLENFERSVSAFQTAANLKHSPQLSLQSKFELAKVAFQTGDYQRVIEWAAEINQHEIKLSAKDQQELDELLADAFLNTSNYPLAIRHIESMKSPGLYLREVYQRVTFLQGVKEFNDGRYARAIEFFNRSLKESLDQETVLAAHYWKGETYSIGRRYEQAIASYQEVLNIGIESNNPYVVNSRYGLGYAYFNTRDYEQALVHFRAYVRAEKEPNEDNFFHDALIRLADSQFATKVYSAAINSYSQAINNKNPQRAYAYLRRGIIHGILENRESALQDYEQVLKNYPNSDSYDEALYQHAELIFQMGEFNRSIDRFSKIITERKKSPFQPYARLRRGLAHFNLEQYDRAKDDYDYLLTHHITHSTANSALLGMQEVLNLKGDEDQFDNYLAKYKAANPDNEDLKVIEFDAAKNLFFAQRYERAISSLQDYLNNYPQTNFRAEANFYIAESHFRLDQAGLALSYYMKVVDQEQGSRTNASLLRIGDIYRGSGREKDAISYYEKLDELASNDRQRLDARMGLIQSYFSLTKYDEVIDYANKIAQMDNVNPNGVRRAQLFLAKALHAKGNFNQAILEYARVSQEFSDQLAAEADYAIAEIEHKRSAFDRSNELLFDFNKKYAAYSTWLDASFLLIAENYEALGDDFQARATLKSIIQHSPNTSTVSEAEARLSRMDDMPEENPEAKEEDFPRFQDFTDQ
ncbi:MAG: tetratricopeptide repeat protein [Cyclobacteriaceae bacterium]|nr:tetratricopeptide repeat protein [Cyclobacteriaceae bacterium]MCH8516456.1 tetratricopeptide repeat protein [Cyclobacteriaceae bacterium]